MQKYLKILEQHVQWIALGLGALCLFLIIWSYVVKPPVVVKLGTTSAQPGEVFETIAKGPISSLSSGINKPNDDVHIDVPDLITPWKDTIGISEIPPRIAGVFRFNPNGNGTDHHGTDNGPQQWMATALPSLEPATPVAINQIRTTVQYPDPKFSPPPNNPQA